MRNQYRTIIGATLLVAAASTSVGAQAPAGPGVFGVYNPVTGTFQPASIQTVPPAPGAIEPGSAVARTGRIRFRLVIKVLSGSPATTLPFCSMSFNHSGVLNSYNESQGLQGSRTGNNALCDLVIPYSWPAANNANPISPSFSLSVGSRGHSESLPPIPLPATDGVTVQITVQVTS
jgi:hypothetical protein